MAAMCGNWDCPVLLVTGDEASLRRFLTGLPGVDQVGVEQRAAGLATRSIKKAAKLWAIDAAISMVDLTTLEGADTPGAVRALCAKARRPDPDRPDVPPVAAVCVYPDLVETAVEALSGSPIVVASVATAIDFDQSTEAFESDSAVLNLLASAGVARTELVSVADAKAHLQATLDSSVNDRVILSADGTGNTYELINQTLGGTAVESPVTAPPTIST
jgi:hypothetical protein